MRPERESRPTSRNVEPASISTAIKSASSVGPTLDCSPYLDSVAESLAGYLVVRVTIDDDGHTRTTIYRSAGAAERAVKRARERGRGVHVTLCQLLPVGVVTGGWSP